MFRFSNYIIYHIIEKQNDLHQHNPNVAPLLIPLKYAFIKSNDLKTVLYYNVCYIVCIIYCLIIFIYITGRIVTKGLER